MSGEGDFLGRWSRRKRTPEVESEAEEQAEPQPAPEPPPEDATAPDAQAEAALLAALPDLSEITAATDIRAFLQKGVPAALRNAALRRAWAADPAIADYTDPARDYFWDWNASEPVPGNSGRLLAEQVRNMADKLRPQEAEAAPEAPAPMDEAPTDPAPEPAPAPVRPPEPPPATPQPSEPPQIARAEDQPAPRRHGSATPT
ncbi:MAG: DUF3306 domain-containing protein [Paracoccus sp. (in: a-proteobacteria)]|nr:DUF3306 domain-containing protein [Paracoccus sp. (in: a-proteobacteria)]